jgi:hypothetical protein
LAKKQETYAKKLLIYSAKNDKIKGKMSSAYLNLNND